jgi:hypothetical protein
MIDRVEEYRRDWESGPTRQTRPRSPLKFYRRKPWLSACVAGGALLATIYWFRASIPGLEPYLTRQVDCFKTELEVSAGLAELRRYYLANAALPPSPEDYLKSSLMANKAYPAGHDFWGTPYRVDKYWDGFGVRSAGPNRRFDDQDDIFRSVLYKALVPR